ILSASLRATMSAGPPAVYGTMNRSGLSGKAACTVLTAACADNAAIARIKKAFLCIIFLPGPGPDLTGRHTAYGVFAHLVHTNLGVVARKFLDEKYAAGNLEVGDTAAAKRPKLFFVERLRVRPADDKRHRNL